MRGRLTQEPVDRASIRGIPKENYFCTDKKGGYAMKDVKLIAFAVLSVVLFLASTQAYGQMMEKEKDMMQEKKMMMEKEKTAMLAGSEGHQAAGTVMLTKDSMGKPILTIVELKIDKVPDGRVYLAKDGDHTKGVELGKLTQFTGAVEYSIPANVNPNDYNSVVVWCKRFDVPIGKAFFEEGMKKKEMMDKGKKMMEKEKKKMN
jgi:hypothetical protein